MRNKTIPARSEQDPKYCWAVTDIFENDEAWEAELAACQSFPEELAGYEGKLGESAKTLLTYLERMEAINRRVEKLYVYGFLRLDEDTANSHYQAMKGRCFSFVVQLSSASSFEGPELVAISDETLDQFYAEEPGLEKYRRYLTKARLEKDHILSPAEENLLAAAAEVGNGPSSIFHAFNDADMKFPEPKAKKSTKKEDFETRDFSTKEMLKSFTFWRAFVFMALITAVGNSVISFARDLVISVDATPALATTLVGVLSVFNGIGRILTGAVYDALGRKTTMLASNILTIFAAGLTLVAVQISSLPLCIAALCLTGLSYGSCPTMTSAFTASFYGTKYFPTNYSLTNFNLIVASFIATFSNSLLISTGSYTAPFVMLLVLAVGALGLNFTIRKP
jgi:hypothetical protein